MDIPYLEQFKNITYEYETEHDTFIARGLQLNMMVDKITDVMDFVDSRLPEDATNFTDINVSGDADITGTTTTAEAVITGTLTVDTINEYTTDAGVTIESMNVEDGVVTGLTSLTSTTLVGTSLSTTSASVSGTLSVDTISELTGAAGVTIDGALLQDTTLTLNDAVLSRNATATFYIADNLEVNDTVSAISFSGTDGTFTSQINVDTIYENGTGNGVTIDGVLLQDNYMDWSYLSSVPDGATTSYGSAQYQIPFANSGNTDFDYDTGFTFSTADHELKILSSSTPTFTLNVTTFDSSAYPQFTFKSGSGTIEGWISMSGYYGDMRFGVTDTIHASPAITIGSDNTVSIGAVTPSSDYDLTVNGDTKVGSITTLSGTISATSGQYTIGNNVGFGIYLVTATLDDYASLGETHHRAYGIVSVADDTDAGEAYPDIHTFDNDTITIGSTDHQASTIDIVLNSLDSGMSYKYSILKLA